jgi:hypothetical protein
MGQPSRLCDDFLFLSRAGARKQEGGLDAALRALSLVDDGSRRDAAAFGGVGRFNAEGLGGVKTSKAPGKQPLWITRRWGKRRFRAVRTARPEHLSGLHLRHDLLQA